MGPSIGLDECGKSGKPRPGSGVPARAEQQKNIYTKLEKLALSCTVTWTWSEMVTLYSRRIMMVPRKTNIYAIKLDLFRKAGPR